MIYVWRDWRFFRRGKISLTVHQEGGAKLNFGLRSEGGRKKTLLKRGIYMTEVSIIKVKKHLFEYMI